MDEYESLSHTKWECKYHVCSFRSAAERRCTRQLRQHLGEVFRKLAEQKESRIEEGHLMPDHVHMMIAIPPKYAVSQVVGFIKGKSAIHLARVYGENRRNFVGQHFLGARVFRVDGGAGRGGDPRVHPQSGAGGQAAGADEPLALDRPLQVATMNLGPRQRPRPAALSGSQFQGPRQRPDRPL